MHGSAITKRIGHIQRAFLLLLLFLGEGIGLGGLGAQLAFALPRDPIDPPPIGDPEPFVPPANGFDWNVPSRFGHRNQDGLIDYHWDGSTYAPEYVHPTEFLVNFDGCPSQAEVDASSTLTTQNTYTWQMDGTTFPPQHTCQFTHTFPLPVNTYTLTTTVTLTIITPQGVSTSFQNDIVVRDILIVSIGDSFASGEGSPDLPQVWDLTLLGPRISQPARWQDTRCHRSAQAGPAQAAIAIEQSDSHTSVTFLSFACSGATITTPSWESLPTNPPIIGIPFQLFDPGIPDPMKPHGAGVLFPYRGTDLPDNFGYNPNDFLPSQIDQVKAAVGNRQIDALLISVGGNDFRFPDIAQACVVHGNCSQEGFLLEGLATGPFSLDQIVHRILGDDPAHYGTSTLGTLSSMYDQLATALAASDFPVVARVYITEYPDLTKDGAGNTCHTMLEDIVWPVPLLIDQQEMQWVSGLDPLSGLGPLLNRAVADAADRHGWHYVDGIASEFISDSLGSGGHGYCASDHWIRRAEESALLQGPCIGPICLRRDTKGTLHPTPRGYQVYATRLAEAIRHDLYPAAPPPSPPTFSSVNTNTEQGNNGWLTGSCTGQTCASTHVVQTVTATDSTGIHAASVAVNGTTGCTVPGVTCATQNSGTQFSWAFDLTSDGIYRLQVTASNGNQQTASFVNEIKVDLHDPIAMAQVSPSTPNAAGWYRSPVAVTLTGADGPGGSGVDNMEYQLDTSSLSLVAPGAQVQINTDGIHTLTYQAVDVAGRRSPLQSLTVQIDRTNPTSHVLPLPSNEASTSFQVQWAGTDVGSGIKDFTISVSDNGGPFTPFVTNTIATSAPYSGVAGHMYRFFSQARDLAGNVEALKTQAEATTVVTRTLASLNSVKLWIGLKNSDDQGTPFDLRAEVSKNGMPVAADQTFCITGVTRNPDQAQQAMVSFNSFTPVSVASGDTLSLQVLTRIGTKADGTQCPGHSNAVGLRLYYDAMSRPSAVSAQITPDLVQPFFLHAGSGDVFNATAPTAPTATFKDSPSVNFKNGNPWQAIGTWSMKLP